MMHRNISLDILMSRSSFSLVQTTDTNNHGMGKWLHSWYEIHHTSLVIFSDICWLAMPVASNLSALYNTMWHDVSTYTEYLTSFIHTQASYILSPLYYIVACNRRLLPDQAITNHTLVFDGGSFSTNCSVYGHHRVDGTNQSPHFKLKQKCEEKPDHT